MRSVYQNISDLAISATAITQDSRQVIPGSIFFALRGSKSDGHDRILEAFQAGALYCVISTENSIPHELSPDLHCRCLQVPDTREAFAWACSAKNGHPSRQMIVIGVTGTSGKTTTTYLIESIFRQAGHKVGVIGTVDFRIGDQSYPSTHTTPASDELQNLLSRMQQSGCSVVVMEVSSHALKQRRTRGVAFDVMVFTNLSREHLDYHADMEDYFSSKKLLFTDYVEDSLAIGKIPQLIVNQDDEYGRRILTEATQVDPECLWTFSLQRDSGARFQVSNFSLTLEGSLAQAQLKGLNSPIVLQTPLLARFNIYNVVAAASAALALKVEPRLVEAGVRTLIGVPGRLERVSNSRGLHLLVDYAHKPDALEKVLSMLSEFKKPDQRIITVIGCGGDRDRGKRPIMGRVSAQYSDLSIVTSDNPRTERPSSIIEEILQGIPNPEKILVREDRRQAIFEAVQLARAGDIVLIAGKGHEDYQILGDPKAPDGVRKVHFDDRKVASEASQIVKKS
ncbi:MAG: UDP-N-acetylmuramoyl-L-alanyl-D-glutamate--2,6-diaminopimelate ligase [Bdellovibrionales bacterium]|nr:UDP-N-acetylmuramoyl-L-alanyl-D-glutamate--2,6-diaminopimelate ligase [Bdellovibrionales bacterium]